MANVSKYIKIHPKVLIQWEFDSNNFISENYKVVTNINEDKKGEEEALEEDSKEDGDSSDDVKDEVEKDVVLFEN